MPILNNFIYHHIAHVHFPVHFPVAGFAGGVIDGTATKDWNFLVMMDSSYGWWYVPRACINLITSADRKQSSVAKLFMMKSAAVRCRWCAVNWIWFYRSLRADRKLYGHRGRSRLHMFIRRSLTLVIARSSWLTWASVNCNHMLLA
jgi:hypothetical protein